MEMMILAGAIVLAMVLYLVDKNQKWGAFKAFLKLGGGIAVLAIGAFLIYGSHESRISAHNRACAAKIRAAYPGSYDDLSDATLTAKTIAKYPHFCD